MKTKKKTPLLVTIILLVVVILAGLATGYALTELFPKQQTVAVGEGGAVDPNQVEAGKVFGDTDDSKFPDTADGVLVKGGIEGEGSHHLMRTGGPARNVYLTSSVLDLDQFVNHQVEVRGETFNAQKAGWLMDVGQVKVVALNAQKPFEEEPPEEVMPE